MSFISVLALRSAWIILFMLVSSCNHPAFKDRTPIHEVRNLPDVGMRIQYYSSGKIGTPAFESGYNVIEVKPNSPAYHAKIRKDMVLSSQGANETAFRRQDRIKRNQAITLSDQEGREIIIYPLVSMASGQLVPSNRVVKSRATSELILKEQIATDKRQEVLHSFSTRAMPKDATQSFRQKVESAPDEVFCPQTNKFYLSTALGIEFSIYGGDIGLDSTLCVMIEGEPNVVSHDEYAIVVLERFVRRAKLSGISENEVTQALLDGRLSPTIGDLKWALEGAFTPNVYELIDEELNCILRSKNVRTADKTLYRDCTQTRREAAWVQRFGGFKSSTRGEYFNISDIPQENLSKRKKFLSKDEARVKRFEEARQYEAEKYNHIYKTRKYWSYIPERNTDTLIFPLAFHDRNRRNGLTDGMASTLEAYFHGDFERARWVDLYPIHLAFISEMENKCWSSLPSISIPFMFSLKTTPVIVDAYSGVVIRRDGPQTSKPHKITKTVRMPKHLVSSYKIAYYDEAADASHNGSGNGGTRHVRGLVQGEQCGSPVLQQLEHNLHRAVLGEPSIQSERLTYDGNKSKFTNDKNGSNVSLVYEEHSLSLTTYAYSSVPHGWLPDTPEKLIKRTEGKYGKLVPHGGYYEPISVRVDIDGAKTNSLKRMLVIRTDGFEHVLGNELNRTFYGWWKPNRLEGEMNQGVTSKEAYALYHNAFSNKNPEDKPRLVECTYNNGSSLAFWYKKYPDGISDTKLKEVYVKHPLLTIGAPREQCPSTYKEAK